jgi:formamidopyrimidine-DNA glycosylase (fpg)
MPELPEVETVARGIHQAAAHKTIRAIELRRAGLRFPFPDLLDELLIGRQIKSATRRAKYILLDFEASDLMVVWHLGMSGRVLILNQVLRQPVAFDKHDHFIMTLEDQTQLRFRDPRRFGFIKLIPRQELITALNVGIEPFDVALTPDFLKALLLNKKQSIKGALLDQRVIAGIGNIYACEALLRAKIDPWKAAGALTLEDLTRLIPEVQQVLQEAIAAGGSTLKDHAQVNGEMGYFQKQFAVYGRASQDCIQCQNGVIVRKMQHGRSTFFCPECQSPS